MNCMVSPKVLWQIYCPNLVVCMTIRGLMVWFMWMVQMPTTRSISQTSFSQQWLCNVVAIQRVWTAPYSSYLHNPHNLNLPIRVEVLSKINADLIFFFYSLLQVTVTVPAPNLVTTGNSSQHADVLFLLRHSQRNGVLDESNDRCCTCSLWPSQKVCENITNAVIFTECLNFFEVWRLQWVVLRLKGEEDIWGRFLMTCLV